MIKSMDPDYFLMSDSLEGVIPEMGTTAEQAQVAEGTYVSFSYGCWPDAAKGYAGVLHAITKDKDGLEAEIGMTVTDAIELISAFVPAPSDYTCVKDFMLHCGETSACLARHSKVTAVRMQDVNALQCTVILSVLSA